MNPLNEKEGGLWKKIDKNRYYWPRGVHVDAIIEYFSTKKVVMWDVLVVNGTRKSLIF